VTGLNVGFMNGVQLLSVLNGMHLVNTLHYLSFEMFK
jgi:hypothetical protein